VVFVPTFNQRSDEIALKTLDQAMPTYRIEPVRCDWLVVGLGTLHCLTMQQPHAISNEA
jgi:agmatine deiminase